MHPQLIEELEHHQGPRHWVTADSGYCCLTNFAGGDCSCHGDPGYYPTTEELVSDGCARDGRGHWVRVGSPCSVDGRPVAPEA